MKWMILVLVLAGCATEGGLLDIIPAQIAGVCFIVEIDQTTEINARAGTPLGTLDANVFIVQNMTGTFEDRTC